MGKRKTDLERHEATIHDWLSTYCGFKEDGSGTLSGTLRNLLAEHAALARAEQREALADPSRLGQEIEQARGHDGRAL